MGLFEGSLGASCSPAMKASSGSSSSSFAALRRRAVAAARTVTRFEITASRAAYRAVLSSVSDASPSPASCVIGSMTLLARPFRFVVGIVKKLFKHQYLSSIGLAEISSGHWLRNTLHRKNDSSTASSAGRSFVGVLLKHAVLSTPSLSVPQFWIRRNYSLLIKRTANIPQPPPLFGSASLRVRAYHFFNFSSTFFTFFQLLLNFSTIF